MEFSQGMTRHSARKVLFTIMRKWVWLFIFAVAFAVLLSAFYWYKAYSEYSVSATFIPVVQNEEAGVSTDLGKFSALASEALLKNNEILEAVSKSLDFEAPVDALDEAVSLSMNETAAAVTVIVKWRDKAQANSILDAYKANLDYAITHTANAGTIKWLNALASDGTPPAPNKKQSYVIFIIGALIGMLFGACFAYFTGSLDKRVFDLERVCCENSKMIMIGTVGKDIKSSRLPVHGRVSGRHGRQLAASALYLNKLMEAKGKILLMCVSPTRKCGTSTVVRKLALILSGMKMKTLILTVTNKSSKTPLPEKPEIIPLSAGIDSCTCLWDASESNRSFIGGISSLLSGAMQQYSLILIDCPPLLENIEISALAEGMDATLLVCRYGHTKYADVTAAASLLFRAEKNPVYCIWNDTPPQYENNFFPVEPTDHRKALNG